MAYTTHPNHGELVKEGMERAKRGGKIVGRARCLAMVGDTRSIMLRVVERDLSVREGARLLSVSRTTIRRYCNELSTQSAQQPPRTLEPQARP